MISIWLPVAITFCAFFVAGLKAPEGGTYGAGHLIALVYLMIAAIVSLLAWLIWSLAS